MPWLVLALWWVVYPAWPEGQVERWSVHLAVVALVGAACVPRLARSELRVGLPFVATLLAGLSLAVAVHTGSGRFPEGLRWSGALLYQNGVIEETGLAAGVLDHPANGISWICKRFAPHGIGLEPGQLLLSGSFTRPIMVSAGDHIRADYGPLGEIAVVFV